MSGIPLSLRKGTCIASESMRQEQIVALHAPRWSHLEAKRWRMSTHQAIFSARSCIEGEKLPTQCQPRSLPRHAHVVCTFWVHPPTSPVPPFLLMQNLTPSDIVQSDIMKLSLMPSTDRYIWEKVKLCPHVHVLCTMKSKILT